MRLLRVLSSIVLLSSFAQAHPLSNPQTVFDSFDHGLELEFGASHLSEWCALSKRKFLKAVRDDDASEWTVVMGNEAGGSSTSRNETTPFKGVSGIQEKKA